MENKLAAMHSRLDYLETLLAGPGADLSLMAAELQSLASLAQQLATPAPTPATEHHAQLLNLYSRVQTLTHTLLAGRSEIATTLQSLDKQLKALHSYNNK